MGNRQRTARNGIALWASDGLATGSRTLDAVDDHVAMEETFEDCAPKLEQVHRDENVDRVRAIFRATTRSHGSWACLEARTDLPDGRAALGEVTLVTDELSSRDEQSPPGIFRQA